jgi:internalin A
MESNNIGDLIKEAQRNKVTVLNLSFKNLTSLPPEISKLKNLTELDLSRNQLTTLPPEISELKNLTELDISENQLTSLPPEISELKNLTKLNLYDNQLTSLPPEILELENLAELYISRNQLTTLPPEISKLKNLTELHISRNQLTTFPPGILKLKNLTQLNIAGNQLTTLPPEILELDMEIEWEERWKFRAIYLPDNPFEYPPVEIVKKGREAVLDYFKSFEGEKKPLNEVKVLLVGDGGAGKTSLVKRLVGEEFDGNEYQTQGINIKEWRFKNKKKEIKVNFWDFGGQEIMHATHQFFLSKRSLYILVLDSRREEKAEYWLKHIRSFGGDSPILVVLNKIDENRLSQNSNQFYNWIMSNVDFKFRS